MANPYTHTEILKRETDLALQPPEIRQPVPRHYWPDVDDYTMSSGFARTPKGRIFLSWFGIEDGADTVMLAAWSDDDGRTWSEPKFLIDRGYTASGVHLSALVGTMWCDPAGRIWWLFSQSLGYFDGRAGAWAAVCEQPDAEFPAWSEPFRLADGVTLNKPTVLANGDWLLPQSLWGRWAIWLSCDLNARERVSEEVFAELDPLRRANVLRSRDQGKNWELIGGQRVTDCSFDEPMIVESAAGKLNMYARDIHGIVVAESTDGGVTWSSFRREAFTACARFFVRKLQSGRWLMVRHNPETPGTRSHLTAFLSVDEGRSWRGGLLLDEREGVSYPDGFQHPDGRIFVQYDRLRNHGEILMAVFTEEDILARKPISGKTVLKHPVMQSKTQLALS